jgi:hypothetical protein
VSSFLFRSRVSGLSLLMKSDLIIWRTGPILIAVIYPSSTESTTSSITYIAHIRCSLNLCHRQKNNVFVERGAHSHLIRQVD